MSVRLLRVEVRPVFVVDDGEDLAEVNVQPVSFSAGDWKALDPRKWADDGAAQIEAQVPAGD
jgi:hypothetical protein